jgi:hypothetical protein
MQTYQIEYPISDLKRAVEAGFTYLESMDYIVGSVYVTPAMAKQLVLNMADDIQFDYIPEGIGMLRTAYLKFMPSVKENEIRFFNQDKSVELRLYLK